MINSLSSIANQFASGLTQISPLGHGLINDTYLVTTPLSSFVLQRINRTVFPEPLQIMENLTQLNQHIARKTSAVVKLKIPETLKTIDNKALYQDQTGDYWRALSFIEHTESIETIGTLSDAEQTGFALGHFHRLLSDLEPLLLHDTLPGFHITPDYLKRYFLVLQFSEQRKNDYCAEFIAHFGSIADDLENAKQQGLLSLRVIHGDPKLNNFLFDIHSHKIVSIIDLDTVKPGLVHYDIGDCLRSCCYRSDPVDFDLTICTALLKSYLSEAGAFFTERDYHYLYPAIRLIPFELGLRFYTDYLEGNKYFKVTDSEQNLRRAINQFRLCTSIIAQELAIKSLILQLQIKLTINPIFFSK